MDGGTIRPHFDDFSLSFYPTYRTVDFRTTFKIYSRQVIR